ncbi:dTMP kinase [Halovivax gelatinilyticus]|uniref:dTMP kinase n=1 Tax=Halovivax gelatinilyticus TaxID=2961597 RepID=UPI0020CA5673|nr:hypothetical protein [Halovivax gelatinilyticus]
MTRRAPVAERITRLVSDRISTAVGARLPALVVVTGIDGAGKTTQAKLLARHLRERGLDVRYEHAIGPNTRPVRALKDRVAGRFLDREATLARDGDTGSGGERLVGGLFLARGLWQAWAGLVTNVGADVVVADRYLYDDLVRVAWRYGYDVERLATLCRLAPEPDLLVRLVSPSDVAWERETDGRTTLTEHAAKNACYDRLFGHLAERYEIHPIDTDAHDVRDTHETVRERVDEKLRLNGMAPLHGGSR